MYYHDFITILFIITYSLSSLDNVKMFIEGHLQFCEKVNFSLNILFLSSHRKCNNEKQ